MSKSNAASAQIAPGPAADGGRYFGRRSWPTVTVAVLGVIASLSLSLTLRSRETQRLAADFRLDAEHQARLIERELDHAINLVHSLTAFYEGSQEVERDEFRVFSKHLLSKCPAVQALEWVPRVTADQRAAHEESTRAAGLTDYTIREESLNGEMVPAGRREEYFPVLFVEPYSGNARAVGFDLGSETMRSQTLQRACETGEAIVSGPISLVQEEGDSCGLLLCEPVFRTGSPASTPADRKTGLAGFYVCVLRMDEVVRQAIGATKADGIGLRLIDETDDGNDVTVYDHPSRRGSRNAGSANSAVRKAPGDLEHVIMVEVPGRRWRAKCVPRRAYVAQRRSWGPWIALFVGLLITGLVTANIGGFVAWSCRVERLADQRTAQLREANITLDQEVGVRQTAEELFRGLLGSVPDAVMIVDDTGKITLVNDVAEQLFGYHRDELLGQPVEVVVPEGRRERHRDLRLKYHQCPHVRPMAAGAELVGLRKDGSEFPAEISLGPLHTEQGARVIAVVRDVSERKRLAAEQRHTRAQLIAAERIQQHLLPDAAPALPGFDVAGCVRPVEFAAGDHYDFLDLQDGSTAIVIGDVTGHGFAPALLMVATRALLRSFSQNGCHVGDVLAKTNDVLCRETEDDRFVTLLLAQINPADRSLHYTSAGHPTGYVLDASGDVKTRLESTSLPLAALPTTRFPTVGPLPLEEGDLVLLLTDGVLEVPSHTQGPFGADRVLSVVRENRHRSAREIIDQLLKAIHDFAQDKPLFDDVTMVVVKVAKNGE
jgi:PAS domain S-box-containing protein